MGCVCRLRYAGGAPKKLLIVAAGLLLVVALWPPVGSLYALTGEDALLAQLRGVVHWLNTAVRPQPQLAADTIPNLADVVPYGVNTFLEQEAEIAKRETSLQLASQAGFRFIRQEFVWEDIEIHGKGDFEDRRHEPFRSAWEKYDNIVDLAEANEIEIIARLSNPPTWSRALPVETTGTLAPPDNYDDFGDFALSFVCFRREARAAAFVEHFVRQVDHDHGFVDFDIHVLVFYTVFQSAFQVNGQGQVNRVRFGFGGL